MSISIKKTKIDLIKNLLKHFASKRTVFWAALFLSIISIFYCYLHKYIVIYGDAESHLNIAKRVVESLTPGFAQLGGIWLPLPHLLMVPFIWSDFLWKTGLAGAIVSGIAFVISSVYIFKTGILVFKNKVGAFVASLVFMLNPNILYMQATPMTELVLICFFILSTYYFIDFLQSNEKVTSLIAAAFFGFCAVLSRYDGWFLVVLEAGILVLYYIPWKRIQLKRTSIVAVMRKVAWKRMEGNIILFISLAFLGIVMWLGWDWLILGNPFYFTTSQFSAAAQQQEWLSRGMLPAYHNLGMSFMYYFVTAMSNAGIVIYFAALVGFFYYLGDTERKHRFYIMLLLCAPFIFNVITLFLGQSVIFIPHLTPAGWEHTMFNVRYGLMTVPLVAIVFGYLFYKSNYGGKLLLMGIFLFQFALYGIGYSPVISFQDGIRGLSSQAATLPDAQFWFAENYDHGLVLMDDFAKTISITRTPVHMRDMIYVGNKPYWEESLVAPEKYARWIIAQKDDTIWKQIIENPETLSRLYTYFDKVYTSDEILIFRKKDTS